MNPTNFLLRRFGSTDQKIRAIKYDMQKKQDEIEYALTNLSITDDFNMRQFWQNVTLRIESDIDQDRLELERLEK